MNIRQKIAFQNPIQFGAGSKEKIFRDLIVHDGMRIETVLTAHSPNTEEPLTWCVEASVLNELGESIVIRSLGGKEQAELRSVAIDLLEGAGDRRCAVLEFPESIRIVKEMSAAEKFNLQQYCWKAVA